jgi:hypothetical protein
MSLGVLWTFVALMLPPIVALLTPLNSVDLAYQVRTGESLLRTGALPAADAYTFTVAGRAWFDQQWAGQVLLALAHRAGGWAGEALLRAVVVTAIFALVLLACRAGGASRRAAAALTITSLVVARSNLGLRPQLFAMALFALTVWILAQRRRRPRLVWLIPLLVVPWANLHGTFALAPLLLALAWLDDWRRGRPRASQLGWLALASVAAATVNPYGLRVWSYVGEISTNDTIRTSISEWAPTSFSTVAGIVFFCSIAGVVAYLARRGRATAWPTLLTLGIFFALGLSAERATAWWALVAPAAVAVELATAGAPTWSTEDQRSIANSVIAGTLAVLAVLSLPGIIRPATAASWSPPDAPIALSDRIGSALPTGSRLFVSQPWASWFEFAVPGDRVAVDSRFELFSEDVWRTYDSVLAAAPGWQRALDGWHVDAIVLRSQDALLPVVAADPRWRLLARTSGGAAFVRASPPRNARVGRNTKSLVTGQDARRTPSSQLLGRTRPDREAARIAASRVPTPNLP